MHSFRRCRARASRSQASKGIMAKIMNKTSRITSAVASRILVRHRNSASRKMAEPTMLNKSSPAQELGEPTHLGTRPGLIRKNRCNHETLSITLIPLRLQRTATGMCVPLLRRLLSAGDGRICPGRRILMDCSQSGKGHGDYCTQPRPPLQNPAPGGRIVRVVDSSGRTLRAEWRH